MNKPTLPPVHPSEILMEEYLKPMGMTVGALSAKTGLTMSFLTDFIMKKASLTPQRCQMLATEFNTTPAFWINMQKAWDAQRASPSRHDPLFQEGLPIQNCRVHVYVHADGLHYIGRPTSLMLASSVSRLSWHGEVIAGYAIKVKVKPHA